MYEEIDAILAEVAALDRHKIRSLDEHLTDMRRYPRLTRLEATELAKKTEIGRGAAKRLAVGELSTDERASLELSRAEAARVKPILIGSNLRLVATIAKSYEDRGPSRIALIEAGNLGLLAAAETFESEKGFTFPVFATWWIRHAMTGALNR